MRPLLRASNEGLPIFLCLSWREWPRLPFTARIERASSHHARSASKKGTWPLPPHLLRPRVARAQRAPACPPCSPTCSSKGMSRRDALTCAHRPSTVASCAVCEHKSTRLLIPSHPSFPPSQSLPRSDRPCRRPAPADDHICRRESP